MSKTIKFGSNPMRFIGFRYTIFDYKFGGDSRPLLRISMLFFVVWFRLPWKHKINVGKLSNSYGLSIILHEFYYHFCWGDKQ